MALYYIDNIYYNGQLTISPDQQRPVVGTSPNMLPPRPWHISRASSGSMLIQFYDANGPVNERGYLTLNPDRTHNGGMEVLLRPGGGGNDLQLWRIYGVATDQYIYKLCSTPFPNLCLTADRPTLSSGMIPVSAIPDGEGVPNKWRLTVAST